MADIYTTMRVGKPQDEVNHILHPSGLPNLRRHRSNTSESSTSIVSVENNDHRRTRSPMDVISLGSTYHQLESNTKGSNTKIKSLSPPNLNSVVEDTSSEILSEDKNISQDMSEKVYIPPTSSSLAECKNHSTESNKNVRDLADILRNRKKMLGSTHPQVASSLNNIGNAHFRRGEFPLAFKAFSEAFEIYNQGHNINQVFIAATLGNLGTVSWRMGNLKESTQFLKDSLEIHQACAKGDDNIEVVGALHNLGLVYFLRRDYKEAAAYLKQALRGRKHVWGSAHVDVARTYDVLGNVYSKAGKPLFALKCHHSALRTKRAVLGSNHHSVVVSFMNIAHAHRQLNEYDDSIIYYKEAYEAQVASMCDDVATKHEMGTTLHLMGLVYMENKKNLEAVKSFTQASRFYIEAGLSPDNECRMKLKQASYNAKTRMRGNRTLSCI